MLKKISWLFFVFIYIFPVNAESTQMILGYSENQNFPYQMGEGSKIAHPPGLAVEIIQKAAESLNMDVKFERFPPARLLQEMKKGRIDGSFIFSYKADRLEFGVYPMKDEKVDSSRRIATINYNFYVKQNSEFKWNGKPNPNPNQKEVIGINFSFSIASDLEKMGYTIDDRGKTTDQNIKKLLSGRFDAYATLSESADIYIKNNEISNIKKLEPPITSRDYYLIISHEFYKKNTEISEKLWDKIGELRDEKLLKEKYFQ